MSGYTDNTHYTVIKQAEEGLLPGNSFELT